MTDKERLDTIGDLMDKLDKCTMDLNCTRNKANRMVLSLRILADCFDLSMTDVNIIQTHDQNTFTFEDSRGKDKRHSIPTNTPMKRITNEGISRPLIKVPNGSALIDTIERLYNLSKEASQLASELSDAGVDIVKISKTLTG